MGVFSKITDALGGSFVKEIVDVAKAYFPPDMPPEKKAELEIELSKIAMEKQRNLDQAVLDSERAMTERIASLEGTAQDLRAIPIVGPVILLLRGMQRLIWGYGLLYGDFMWLSGSWELNKQQESAMWILNFLVLGFLFGERAIQNVMPFFIEMRKQSKD